MKILEGDRDPIMQIERTRRGVCARCGEAGKEHDATGKCPNP